MASNRHARFQSEVHKLANLVEHQFIYMLRNCNEKPGIAALLHTTTHLPWELVASMKVKSLCDHNWLGMTNGLG